MERPPRTKREHLRRLVAGKQHWSGIRGEAALAAGYKGWHERGYLPHCDRPGLVQFVTFRLWDSLPAARRGEWEHLLSADAGKKSSREQRVKLEDYLDRGHGGCCLRDARVAAIAEQTITHHHGQRFQMLAWVVMPNHVHALIRVGDSLGKIIQNWKSVSAVEANRLLGRNGRFWQPDYWDRFMRDEEQIRKAVRYIENNPVKAKFCREPQAWRFSSARFRDPKTGRLELPGTGSQTG